MFLQVFLEGFLNILADKSVPFPKGPGAPLNIGRIVLAAEGPNLEVHVLWFRSRQGVAQGGIGKQFRKMTPLAINATANRIPQNSTASSRQLLTARPMAIT